MRRSVPMPLRTCVTSAPTASHKRAIWFMNEIRVASIAFAAYFVISADGTSMKMIGLPVRTNGAYSSPMTCAATWESTPTTTRSGFMKSSTAAPSFRNSGFEHTWNGTVVCFAISARTRSAVPTGTVLIGRRPHGDEDDVRAFDRPGHVRRELEPAAALIPRHQRLEPRLVNRQPVLPQPSDLTLVHVGADHVVPCLGETRAHHEADISGSDHRDVHGTLPRVAASAFRVSTTRRACRATRP